jgi:hypothetical protein
LRQSIPASLGTTKSLNDWTWKAELYAAECVNTRTQRRCCRACSAPQSRACRSGR